MKIVIANDHRGVDLKNKIVKYLEGKKYVINNIGTNNTALADFPDYAFKVGEIVAKKESDYGILICGTGIGMSIAANKVKGIRCGLVNSVKEARLTREHNDANVIAISASTSFFKAKKIIDTFLTTEFSTVERYHIRLEKIKEYEKNA